MSTILDQVEEAWKAMDILRRVGWGMKSKMRQYVQQYRTSGNVRFIEEAITLPVNRQAKITQWISDNSIELLDEYLLIIKLVTRPQLNTFMQDMVSYADDLFDRYQGGESADGIATDIETNIGNPAERFGKLNFPFPVGYLDKFGR